MLMMLKPGDVVQTQPALLDCKVTELLGCGSQGEVYKAELSDRAVALKWYLPAVASAQQRASIQKLVAKGSPSIRFLWPMELAQSANAPGFGYVMPLREDRYRGAADLMKRRIDPSFRALATAGFQLADSFLQLHSRGLCYKDISFGNLFLDPDTGDILICDNDNVTVDGDRVPGILGTPRFMAPEVVTGLALPGTQTDLFSLAVLLFYLFLVHHPLEGRKELAIHCFDLPAMKRLYGLEPVFIFDPVDRSNEPVKGYHDNAIATWPIYPSFLRDLFTRAFTEGIRDPLHGRVREGEWRAAMIRLRDSVLYCPSCSAENFYGSELNAEGSQCWNCQAPIRLPFRIRTAKGIVMLNHDTSLYPHHVDDQRMYDFSAPIATVTPHPNQVGLWGLTNVSGQSWFVQTAGNPVPLEVIPGKTAALASATRINFGKGAGEIRG
jgi:eukaryotic-like serine/threonine-protein kinase